MKKATAKAATANPFDLESIVREFITSSGLSMREIQEASGVDSGQLSRFIRGERTLTLKTAGRLAECFEFTIKRVKV